MAAPIDNRVEGSAGNAESNYQSAGEEEERRSTLHSAGSSKTRKEERTNSQGNIFGGSSRKSLDKSAMLESNNHMPSKNHRFLEDDDSDGFDHFGSRFMMTEKNPIRLAWSVVLCLLLGYTATAFLYRFTFCTFHIGPNGMDPIGENDVGWKVIDLTVDVLFWIDLFVTFFLTYKDSKGREVDSMKLVAKNYLMFYFWINLLACLPEEAFSSIILAGQEDPDPSNTIDLRVTRVYRLQRISRLARLARVTRLVKFAHIMSSSHIWKWFQEQRGVRVVNFLVGLFWALHLMACGWYLCAALHDDVQMTWVARRGVDNNGNTLLDQPPFEQWLVSMYFVLTVFTTVGFGDISAGTEAEIIYVAFTMLVGAVVHSIIISEVIGIVTSTDEVQKVIDKQVSLIEAFSAHTQLDGETSKQMKSEITWRARNWARSYGFDKKEMKDLITGKYMPRWLIAKMPKSIFNGSLIKNDFIRCVSVVPPRLPCLLAVHLLSCDFEAGEIVYQMGDFPFNIFLVCGGTFSHVGRPGPQGGTDATEAEDVAKAAQGDPQTESSHVLVQALPSTYDEAVNSSTAKTRLFPYRLFSHGSYFGDHELIWGKPRYSTVRCERKGSALTLHKSDFHDLREMLPQFAYCWASQSRRRERYRRHCLTLLTGKVSFKQVAASRIQAFLRRRKQRGAAEQGVFEAQVAEATVSRTVGRSMPRVTHQASSQLDEAASKDSIESLRREVLCLRKDIRQLLKDQGKSSLNDDGDTMCL